jgi:hypothetical protein
MSPYDESPSGTGDDELCCVFAPPPSLLLVTLAGLGGEGSGVGNTRVIVCREGAGGGTADTRAGVGVDFANGILKPLRFSGKVWEEASAE